MSRSVRRTPIFGITTAETEKIDKQKANRRLRRRVSGILAVDRSPDLLPVIREVSDPWKMDKDGKVYRQGAGPADLRK